MKNTHDKILETAAKHFSEKGYSGTSLREIAEDLDISKAALYYHFPNKETMFNSCLEDLMFTFRKLIQDSLTSNLPIWDKLNDLIYKSISISLEKPYTFKLLRMIGAQNFDIKIERCAFKDHFISQIDFFKNILEKGVNEGHIRKDVPVNIMAAAMMTTVQSTIGPFIREHLQLDINPRKHTDYIIKILKGGFGIL